MVTQGNSGAKVFLLELTCGSVSQKHKMERRPMLTQGNSGAVVFSLQMSRRVRKWSFASCSRRATAGQLCFRWNWSAEEYKPWQHWKRFLRNFLKWLVERWNEALLHARPEQYRGSRILSAAGTLRISYLASEKLNFANCFVSRFVLESLAVLHDTLRYPGMYQLMSFEDWMK